MIQLQYFRGLQSLILGDNKIGDVGIKIITDCLTSVRKLQLNTNKFTSKALSNLGNLKELRVLDIRNNNLGDECLKYSAALPNLQELSVSKNGITDAGLPFLT
jgi:Leucine-rich repeat (LRR) protein